MTKHSEIVTRALTVRQPWAWAIMESLKDVENRVWAPPLDLKLPAVIAIHASYHQRRKDYQDCCRDIAEISGRVPPGWDQVERGAILGFVAVLAVLRPHTSPWWRAEHWAWELGEVVRLVRPIPTAGKLGLWALPKPMECHLWADPQELCPFCCDSGLVEDENWEPEVLPWDGTRELGAGLVRCACGTEIREELL